MDPYISAAERFFMAPTSITERFRHQLTFMRTDARVRDIADMLREMKVLGDEGDMGKVEPVTPKEVSRVQVIPDGVLEIVNASIKENWNGNEAVLKQDDLVNRIVAKFNVTRDGIFERRWLDIEKLYRKAGWKVEYHKPDWGESGESFFRFKK